MAKTIIGVWKESRTAKLVFGMVGIMVTLVVYGVLQEKIMRVPYGENKVYFKFSLFLVLCNRVSTSAVSAGALLISKKTLTPAAPMHKYFAISISNILTTTCQYEALKYVSFPVQTLAKCAKMIPVMVWSTIIMQKKYNGKDYFFALLVTLGCFLFILYPQVGWYSLPLLARHVSHPSLSIGLCSIRLISLLLASAIFSIGSLTSINTTLILACLWIVDVPSLFFLTSFSDNINQYQKGRESTVLGILLMICYLGFDGFTSTFQDKLFKGYDMEIYNQIFYTTLCSTFLSFCGLVIQGHLLMAIDFMLHHQDCIIDILLLSVVATASQFFISYTIRTFGALTFATIMTTRQLVSIMLSCVWFSHPLSWEQWSGAVVVFGTLYTKSFVRSRNQQHSSLLPSTSVAADKAEGSSNS